MKSYQLIKYSFGFVFLLFFNKMLMAQQYEWGYSFNGDENVYITAQTVDQEGAIYTFGGTDGDGVDIDPGPNSFIVSIEKGSNFVQKLDSNGNFVWGGQFGASSVPNHRKGLDAKNTVAATTDDHSNIYIGSLNISSYFSLLDTDTGKVDAFLTDLSGAKGIITKINKDGHLLWAVDFPANLYGDVEEGNTFSINTLVTDVHENVYVAGYFFGDSVDFDPGPGESLLYSSGASNGYVVKFDQNGDFQWVVNIEGGDAGLRGSGKEAELRCNCDQVSQLVVDSMGNVILIGTVSVGTVDLDPGQNAEDTFFVHTNELSLSGNYPTTNFIMKLDSMGQFKWGHVINDSATTAYPIFTNVFLNKSNEILLTGAFTGTVDLNIDTGVHYLIAETGSGYTINNYLLNLTSAGTFQWVKRLSPAPFTPISRQGPDGRIYFKGRHASGTSIDYDPSSGRAFLMGAPYLPSTNPDDVVITDYVSCFDPDGRFRWIRSIEASSINLSNPAFEADRNFSIDAKNNIFFSGVADALTSTTGFLDVHPFSRDTARLFFTNAFGQYNGGYVVKWSEVICNSSTTTFGSIVDTACGEYITPSGKVLTTSGTYVDTSINAAGCDSILTIDLTIQNPPTAFQSLIVCDKFEVPNSNQTFPFSGTYLYYLPSESGCDTLITLDLTVLSTSSKITTTSCGDYRSPSGKIWPVTGFYHDTLVNAAGCDSLIFVDLTVLPVNMEYDTVTSCVQYKSPSGKYIWTTSGSYFDTLESGDACDRIISSEVTILSVDKDIEVEEGGDTKILSSKQNFASYQWLNCEDFKPIEGATKQFYAPKEYGTYAVSITTQEGCQDTSVCLPVYPVGIQTAAGEQSFNVFPNPATDYITLQSFDKSIRSMQVIDITGRIWREQQNTGAEEFKMNIQNLPSSMYRLVINTKNGIYHRAFIKY